MTKAYKGGGLFVRNDGSGYSITGAYWSVYFMKGEIPKETLGDLIALVGELPDMQEAYVADKNGNQMEIYDDSNPTAMEAATEIGRTLHITPVILEYYPYFLSILQDDSLQATAVNKDLIKIVQPSLIDAEKGEDLPEGPFGANALIEGRFFNAACWYNNRMAFSIGMIEPSDVHVKNLIHLLERNQLWEDKDDGGVT